MTEYLDDIIFKALKKRKKVELYLCKGIEGGFGIKINKKIIVKNMAWECFEEEIEIKKEAKKK